MTEFMGIRRSAINENKNDLTPTSKEEFETIVPYTRTVIGVTNWDINITALFDNIQTVPYTVVQKKRGRKKKEAVPDPNVGIEFGSIIGMKYQDEKGNRHYKGIVKSEKCFRNAVSVVMVLDKLIDFKVTKNGKFQFTGCKYDEQAEQCVRYLWKQIIAIENARIDQTLPKIINVPEVPVIIFNTVMSNVKFDVGFLIDRYKLHNYLYKHTDFIPITETSLGYAGINTKLKTERPQNFKLKKYVCKFSQDKWKWKRDEAEWKDYLDMLSPKDRAIEVKKERYFSFLIFASGKVILSSPYNGNFSTNAFLKFMEILTTNKDKFEELSTSATSATSATSIVSNDDDESEDDEVSE